MLGNIADRRQRPIGFLRSLSACTRSATSQDVCSTLEVKDNYFSCLLEHCIAWVGYYIPPIPVGRISLSRSRIPQYKADLVESTATKQSFSGPGSREHGVRNSTMLA